MTAYGISKDPPASCAVQLLSGEKRKETRYKDRSDISPSDAKACDKAAWITQEVSV